MLKNECGTLEVSMKTITWKKICSDDIIFHRATMNRRSWFSIVEKKSDDLKPAEAAFNDKKEIEQLTLFWICMKPFWHISCTTQTKKNYHKSNQNLLHLTLLNSHINLYDCSVKFKWSYYQVKYKKVNWTTFI